MIEQGGAAPQAEVGILPARAEDVDTCMALWSRAVTGRDGDRPDDAAIQRIRAKLQQPIIRFAIAGPPPCGFCLTTAGPSATAVLELLAVDPARARHGIGRALLADAIAHTSAQRYHELVLLVRADNVRALRLYRAAGFRPIDEQATDRRRDPRMRAYRKLLDQTPSREGTTSSD